jgi:hypothetical protein
MYGLEMLAVQRPKTVNGEQRLYWYGLWHDEAGKKHWHYFGRTLPSQETLDKNYPEPAHHTADGAQTIFTCCVCGRFPTDDPRFVICPGCAERIQRDRLRSGKGTRDRRTRPKKKAA